MDLKELHEHGQSIWLDYIRRDLLASGEFARLVREDDVRGVTTNPSIFEKAIAESTDYDTALRRHVKTKDEAAAAIYERLVIEDIQQAADVLRGTYDATEGRDGFVSMEVSPYLAHDTRATIAEARRLSATVGRPNVMIKVPGTTEGMPAIEQLTAEGLNINVTLLFGRGACRQVLDAYMTGLEARLARGLAIDGVASVASMFVSRIDVLVGEMIEHRLARATQAQREALQRLVGTVGIANAKLAYDDWKGTQRSARWQSLAARGARPQRLLWASTSTKDKHLSDVAYVEALIGPDTVDTIPLKTLAAMRDHGHAADRLEEGLDDARRTMAELADAGISIDDVTRQLVEEGVVKFSAAFDELMSSVERKRDRVLSSALDRLSYALPEALDRELATTLEDWRVTGKVRRLWARDQTLWTGRDEHRWLDWLELADGKRVNTAELAALADRVAAQGFTHAVVLGMGGSSLCPDVLAQTFGPTPGHPELLVLDSTDPAQIRAVEARIALPTTLFIVSSKSGTTLEPNLLLEYFHERMRNAVGDAGSGLHFIAVTDPGSPLERTAESLRFTRTFPGIAGIGGRYSALSNFGMVPAAVMGLDVPGFLDRTQTMVRACAASVPPHENAGVLLGAILGTLAKLGRDKVTLVASPGIVHLGAWIEQLLAESTGKHGAGLIPVDREPLGPPAVYGDDRVFVYLRLDRDHDAAQDAAVAALEKAQQPVVHLAVAEPFDLGQEMFRWEIAVATAGSILGIDPFDQPDVEASKHAATSLTDEFERTGALPSEVPFCRDGSLSLFADDRNRAALQAAAVEPTLHGYLKAHLDRIQRGDYVALLAFIERNDAHLDELQRIRCSIRDAGHVATCVGFGPRFLHSTGQVYKGGPNTGVVLQLTCDHAADLDVPGHRFGFGIVEAAQARGDLRVLGERGRRALRVHLGRDVGAGLATLGTAIQRALRSL